MQASVQSYGIVNEGKNGCGGKKGVRKTVIAAALAGLMIAGVAGSASAADGAMMASKEKCFGIAKAGKNDCKSVSGAHSCAGQATKDNDPSEFKLVGAGECVKDGGSLTAPK